MCAIFEVLRGFSLEAAYRPEICNVLFAREGSFSSLRARIKIPDRPESGMLPHLCHVQSQCCFGSLAVLRDESLAHPLRSR